MWLCTWYHRATIALENSRVNSLDTDDVGIHSSEGSPTDLSYFTSLASCVIVRRLFSLHLSTLGYFLVWLPFYMLRGQNLCDRSSWDPEAIVLRRRHARGRTEMNRASGPGVLYKYVTRKQTGNPLSLALRFPIAVPLPKTIRVLFFFPRFKCCFNVFFYHSKRGILFLFNRYHCLFISELYIISNFIRAIAIKTNLI